MSTHAENASGASADRVRRATSPRLNAQIDRQTDSTSNATPTAAGKRSHIAFKSWTGMGYRARTGSQRFHAGIDRPRARPHRRSQMAGHAGGRAVFSAAAWNARMVSALAGIASPRRADARRNRSRKIRVESQAGSRALSTPLALSAVGRAGETYSASPRLLKPVARQRRSARPCTCLLPASPCAGRTLLAETTNPLRFP